VDCLLYPASSEPSLCASTRRLVVLRFLSPDSRTRSFVFVAPLHLASATRSPLSLQRDVFFLFETLALLPFQLDEGYLRSLTHPPHLSVPYHSLLSHSVSIIANGGPFLRYTTHASPVLGTTGRLRHKRCLLMSTSLKHTKASYHRR